MLRCIIMVITLGIWWSNINKLCAKVQWHEL